MQIHWSHCGEIGDAERERVETRLRALARESDDLREIWIGGQSNDHHRHGGREIRLSARVCGRDIAASEVRPDLTQALHDALEEFERQVHRRRDLQRDLRRRPGRQPAAQPTHRSTS